MAPPDPAPAASFIEGRVVDSEDRPIPEGRVLVYDPKRGPDPESIGIVADERGKFRGAVPSGARALIAFQPSFPYGELDPKRVSEDYARAVLVEVPAGGVAGDVTVRLPYAVGRLCRVAGRILVDGKGGDWGAQLSIDGIPLLPEQRRETACDGEGRFEFRDVLPGDRMVKFSGTRWFEAGEVSLRLGESEQRSLVIEPPPRPREGGLTIRIRCRHADGEWLEGVQVRIEGNDGYLQMVRTGAGGEVVVRGLPEMLREWVLIVVIDERYCPEPCDPLNEGACGIGRQAPFHDWPDDVVLIVKTTKEVLGD